jgi:hypothetical protein
MGLLEGLRKGTPEQRAEMKSARQELKRLDKEHAAFVRPQQKAYESALKQHEKAVAAARAEVAGLEAPGKGAEVAELGNFKLFEHVVVAVPTRYGRRDDRFEVPLADVSVRTESSATHSYIYFDMPDGEIRMISFQTEWVRKVERNPAWNVPDKVFEERSFDDGQVRHFALEIQNAVAQENQFRKDLPQLLDLARRRAVEVEADTANLWNLWERYQCQCTAWPRSAELHAARIRLDAATAALGTLS